MAKTIIARLEGGNITKQLVIHNPEILERLIDWFKAYNRAPVNLPECLENGIHTIEEFIFDSHNNLCGCDMKFRKLAEQMGNE